MDRVSEGLISISLLVYVLIRFQSRFFNFVLFIHAMLYNATSYIRTKKKRFRLLPETLNYMFLAGMLLLRTKTPGAYLLNPERAPLPVPGHLNPEDLMPDPLKLGLVNRILFTPLFLICIRPTPA